MTSKRVFRSGLYISLAVLSLIYIQLTDMAYAAENEESDVKPDRLITMAVEYPGVQIARDEDEVSMDIIFHNKGKSDENVNVWIAEKPPEWKARIKTYRYAITGVHVPSGNDKTVTFEAEPDKSVQPGKYDFLIKAQTPDNKFQMSQKLSIEVMKQESKADESKDLKLTTSYPVIRGPSDASFKFSVEVDSKLEKDAVFDLFAQGPEGWDVNFKPAYEDKYISSLRLKAGENKSLDVEVKPSVDAQAGKHPVNIRVSSGSTKAEATLTVILTGTYELEVGTPSGLLSLDAKQGKPANMSFYIKNTGSATNNDIKFLSFKPENWKVEFNPEKIDSIEPGDLKQVEMTITPNEDALVGDYSVSVNVKGQKVTKNLELRTTVKASAAWGWVGIGIIVIVIAGLFGIFRWLGRR
jgi:uncharacterized membrane protein